MDLQSEHERYLERNILKTCYSLLITRLLLKPFIWQDDNCEPGRQTVKCHGYFSAGHW